MAQNRPRYVPTFRAPTEYELELERARRQKALAEALAQQEYQPLEGAAAPIPRAAPLVKALQGYLTARAGRQAEEAEKAAEKAGRVEIADYIRSFEPEQRTVGAGDIAAMEATAPQIDAQGRVSYSPPSAVAAPNQRLMPAMTATGEPNFSQPMQMQVGGPLSMAQRRARALEGLESTNPLVQQFAAAQYEKTMPRELDLKLAPIDPEKVDLSTVAEAQRTGDISRIKPRAAPEKPVTRTGSDDLGDRVRTYFSDGSFKDTPKGIAPTTGGGKPSESPEGLRKEFTAQTAPYRGVADAFVKIKNAAMNPSAANDLALIFSYMRALDPASTVREGEFATAQNAAGVDVQVRNLYNKVVSGERLSQPQRQDFLQSSYGMVESQMPNLQQIIDRYTGIANRSGLNPEDIVNNPLQSLMIPRLTSDNDPVFEKLNKGDLFIAPNGKMMRKR